MLLARDGDLARTVATEIVARRVGTAADRRLSDVD